MNLRASTYCRSKRPCPRRPAQGCALALLCLLICRGGSSAQATRMAAPEADPEVRVEDYFVDRYEYPNRVGQFPRVNVTFAEAAQLCKARNKRLCTEHEWETACRGTARTPYGYGPQFIAGQCNTPYRTKQGWQRNTGMQPAGTYPECGPSDGVRDMIGNVWEWTDGWYDERRGWRVVRGGSWFHNLNFARADGRDGRGLTADYQLDLIGFRCCRDAEP